MNSLVASPLQSHVIHFLPTGVHHDDTQNTAPHNANALEQDVVQHWQAVFLEHLPLLSQSCQKIHITRDPQ